MCLLCCSASLFELLLPNSLRMRIWRSPSCRRRMRRYKCKSITSGHNTHIQRNATPTTPTGDSLPLTSCLSCVSSIQCQVIRDRSGHREPHPKALTHCDATPPNPNPNPDQPAQPNSTPTSNPRHNPTQPNRATLNHAVHHATPFGGRAARQTGDNNCLRLFSRRM